MRKIFLVLLIATLFIIALVIAAFIYFFLVPSQHENQFTETRINIPSNLSDFVLEPVHLTYLLSEIGANNLHNKPVSSDCPRIEISVDGELFTSEIVKGGIITTSGKKDEKADLRIITSKTEVFNVLTSGNAKEYIQNSVASGKTRVELDVGYTDLFLKGYLGLYKELTGKSFPG